MRTSIRVAAVTCVLALAASARAASFSLVSGTIHAEDSATPGGINGGSSATVTSTPADAILGGSVTSGSAFADAKTNFGNQGDAQGSFHSSGSFSSSAVGFNISGSAQGNGGNAAAFGSSSGSGFVDILFTLDEQAKVQFLASGTPQPSFYFSPVNVSLKLNGTSVASIPSGDVLFTQVLDPGSYELSASASVHPGAGTAGAGGQSLTISVVPEPLAASMLVLAGTCWIGRRRHTLR